MNEIIKNKKLYIFDMDGTIYLGDQVFECAVKLIIWLRNNGRRVMFFTNNASHTPGATTVVGSCSSRTTRRTRPTSTSQN